MIIPILGGIGTLIGLIRAWPQLAKLLQTRRASGVSVDSAATSAIVSFGWASYGLMTGQIYVSLATGLSGTIFFLVTIFALRFGRKYKEFKIAPIWLVILSLAGIIFGQDGLGIMLPISVLAANTPQLWVAHKEVDLTDLSLGTWLLSMADGLVWGAYALIQGDTPIMAFAIFQLTTSAVIVALKQMHKTKATLVRKSY